MFIYKLIVHNGLRKLLFIYYYIYKFYYLLHKN